MVQPATLEDLIDRARISDTVLAYATGVDRRDWALYRGIFEDEVVFDFETWSGEPARSWPSIISTARRKSWAVSIPTGFAAMAITGRSFGAGWSSPGNVVIVPCSSAPPLADPDRVSMWAIRACSFAPASGGSGSARGKVFSPALGAAAGSRGPSRDRQTLLCHFPTRPRVLRSPCRFRRISRSPAL